MNERLKELAEQAEDYSYTEYAKKQTGYTREDFFKSKFAELIVREYEKLLPDICPWVDADKEGPMKGWHVQFVARKHFGVDQ